METDRLPRWFAIASCLLMSLASSGLMAYECWTRPYCSCTTNRDSPRTTIYCSGVRDVSDVVELFRNQTPIFKIRLRGSFATLPSGAFDGIAVQELSLTAPLSEDIPGDSLSGAIDLRSLVLNGTRFRSLPGAFSNLANVTSLVCLRGQTVALQDQLQNMTSAQEIVFRHNALSSVSGRAFEGTDKVQRLDLSHNEIAFLDPDTFERTPFLEEVVLAYNRLQTVDGLFRSLNPKSIDLYSNELTSVDEVFHQGMWNLKRLDLGANRGLQLTESTFNGSLKSLVGLHLCNGGFRLDPDLLRNLWNLRFLYLNGNNLTALNRYFLAHTPFITVLELSNNRLKDLGGILESPREWHNSMKLTLDGNELTTVSLGKARVSVHSFDISRNRVAGVKVEDTATLQKSVYLNLSRNEIGFLEADCFGNFLSLQQIDLSHNRLTGLNETLRNLPKLTLVQLNSNNLETLTSEDFRGSQKIKNIYLGNNSLTSVYGAFRDMTYIQGVNLSLNNLTTLTADSFPPFQKISIRVRDLWMANNPWTCDCRLAWFSEWVQKKESRLKDEPLCASPDHLRGAPLSRLNRTDFERWTRDCPAECDCACRVDETDHRIAYTEVSCPDQGLREVPEVMPANARWVDLRRNEIGSLEGGAIGRLGQLQTLNLESNRIQKVRLEGLPPTLSTLRLAVNDLKIFPVEEWLNVSLTAVTLSRNPWTCDCDTWPFRNWLIEHNQTVLDVHEVRCGSDESLSLRNRPIIMLTRKDLCSHLSSIALISGCCALLLVVCVVCLCFRKSIAAGLYSCGCACLKTVERHSYPYDAFLLYNEEEDEDLALGELAKGLESGSSRPFHLCLQNRDIPSPRTVQKVKAYLAQCTKVIVLLTRKFIENQECMHLMISAMSFSTESSSRSIIFVTHGELPPPSELDAVLRTLLRSCACIKWGECLFWQKLRYQLPKKNAEIRNCDDNPDEVPLLN